MKKVVVVANCQAGPMSSLLNMASSQIESVRVPAVHTIKGEMVENFHEAVGSSDFVIHQPIGKNFGPVSSQELRAKFPDKVFVTFPSIFFGGLFPHLCYLRSPTGGTLKGPLGDYHDLRILNSWLDGKSVEECVRGLDELDFDIVKFFESSVDESMRRDGEVDVPVMDIVLDRIKHEQTFYTFNHVTNDLLWQTALRVLGHLGIPADGAKSPPKREYLSGITSSIPLSVTEKLGFGWKSPQYFVSNAPVPWEALIGETYALYDSLSDIEGLLKHNAKRLSPQLPLSKSRPNV